MSQYKETSDEIDRKCPYCGYEYQVEGEDYSDEERIEICENCGMKFLKMDEFSVTHYARPDCNINGDKHSFVTFFSKGKEYLKCKKCGFINV